MRMFQPIPPLTGEPRELIDFDDDLLEDPTIASLCGVDTTAQILEESSQKEEEENNVDTVIAMCYVSNDILMFLLEVEALLGVKLGVHH